MTEQQIYDRVVAIRNELDELCDAVMELQPTIELCVFMGKLSAAFDVLQVIVEAGAPVSDPGEGPHPLDRYGSGGEVMMPGSNSGLHWCPACGGRTSNVPCSICGVNQNEFKGTPVPPHDGPITIKGKN